jgi:hypothetical protein
VNESGDTTPRGVSDGQSANADYPSGTPFYFCPVESAPIVNGDFVAQSKFVT